VTHQCVGHVRSNLKKKKDPGKKFKKERNSGQTKFMAFDPDELVEGIYRRQTFLGK
jgi:hypothetical protein